MWFQQREGGLHQWLRVMETRDCLSRKALLKQRKGRNVARLSCFSASFTADAQGWENQKIRVCQGTWPWVGSKVEWVGIAKVVHLTSWMGKNSCLRKSKTCLNWAVSREGDPYPRDSWCSGAICGALGPSCTYLLMLCTPPLLLPAHLLLVVPALFPLLLLPQLLLSPLLLGGNKQTTMNELNTIGGCQEASRESCRPACVSS